MDNNFDLEKIKFFSFETANIKLKPPRHKQGELFLKGPIPMKWLETAARQSGKALHVALEIWFWAGIKRSHEIKLSISKLSKMGVKRNSAYRGLDALEKAGLISVKRHRGRLPIVKILDFSEVNAND